LFGERQGTRSTDPPNGTPKPSSRDCYRRANYTPGVCRWHGANDPATVPQAEDQHFLPASARSGSPLYKRQSTIRPRHPRPSRTPTGSQTYKRHGTMPPRHPSGRPPPPPVRFPPLDPPVPPPGGVLPPGRFPPLDPPFPPPGGVLPPGRVLPPGWFPPPDPPFPLLGGVLPPGRFLPLGGSVFLGGLVWCWWRWWVMGWRLGSMVVGGLTAPWPW
jgi:hypothetical protein